MSNIQDIQTSLKLLESLLARQGNAELIMRQQRSAQAIVNGSAGVDVYEQLAQLAIHLQRPDLAVNFYVSGLQVNASSATLYYNYADLLRRLGRSEDAIAHYKLALDYQPDLVDAYLDVATILREQQRIGELIVWLQDAIDQCPQLTGLGAAGLRVKLGEAVKISGDIERAITLFRDALTLAPGHAYTYQTLAHTKKFIDHDEDIRQMQRLFSNPLRKREDRVRFGFALGKAFEDLKDYEQSFHYYQQANSLNRSAIQYDTRDTQSLFDALINNFSRELFAGFQTYGSSGHEPIFIVGMPRSGTTLVEQILAAHPAVYGAGELSIMNNIVATIWEAPAFAGMNYPAGVDRLQATLAKEAAEFYLQTIRRLAPGNEHKVTDKMPHNFIHLGMIKLLLPNAKIIHCCRHPLDTCLSLYKHLFSGVHPYCYDLTELGQYYCLYQQLMSHWHEVLPGYIYDIDYTALINNPRQEIEKLISFCDLPWHEACLEHNKSKNRSITASSVQVNKPIYKDALDYWRHYAPFLQPLQDALQLKTP